MNFNALNKFKQSQFSSIYKVPLVMNQRDLPTVIAFPFYLKYSIWQKMLSILAIIIFVFLATNIGVTQTTVNLAPCTNCSADTTCLPAQYTGSLGGSTSFATVSTTAGSPTNLGTPLVFTLAKDSWVNLQFSGSTGQTGGPAGNENTQVIFYLTLDGATIQTSSNDATGQHGSLGDNRTINYNIDLDNWQHLVAGTYTMGLGAVRHTNLDRGVISGSFIVMSFPDCGFGGGASASSGASGMDTLYIASDTCVAARAVHDVAQNLLALTNTQLNFGTESYDSGNNFSGNQFTVVEDGLYFINNQASVLTPGENDWVRLFIYKNGVSIAHETENNGRTVNSSVGLAINTTVYLTAGDIITSHIYTTSAAPTQANRGYLEIRRVDCGNGTSAASTSLPDTVYVMPTPCDFGTEALDAALDITVTLPAIQNTTAQITLPTAGTYRITGDFNGQIRSSDVITSGLNGYIYDVTNALTIRSGSILSSDEPGNNVLGGNAITTYYTVTGPTVLRLQVGVSNLGGTDIAKLSARTQIHYERIDCGNAGGSGSANSTTDTLYIGAAQNIPALTTTQLNFGTESYDLGNNFNANQFTVVEDGLYFINVQASVLLASENDWTRLFIEKNGATIASETENNGRAANSSVGVAVNTTVFLTVGDVITSSIFTTTASSSQANRGYFEIRRVDCGNADDAGGASSTPQTLAYDPATDSLTISGGNTISITRTPNYGIDFLDASLDVTAQSPTYENTTTVITLPSAGTYRVTLNAHGQVRTVGANPCYINAQMYDETNATNLGIIPVIGADESGSNILGGSSYERFLTVVGPTVIRVRATASNQAAADVIRLRTTTQLLYQKLD